RITGITRRRGGPERLAVGPHGRAVPGPLAWLAAVGWSVAWCGVVVEAGQFFQRHVELDLGGLPGPVRQAPGSDKTPARLLQRVVVTLPLGAGVLRADFLAQRVQ